MYLWHRANGVHLSNEFTIGLEQQKQLEVKFVESLTQLQLLWMIKIHQSHDIIKESYIFTATNSKYTILTSIVCFTKTTSVVFKNENTV